MDGLDKFIEELMEQDHPSPDDIEPGSRVHEPGEQNMVRFVFRGLAFTPEQDTSFVIQHLAGEGFPGVEYIGEITTLPGQGGEGGRTDQVFDMPIEHIPRFAIWRLRFSGCSWWDDYLDNDGDIIPPEDKQRFRESKEVVKKMDDLDRLIEKMVDELVEQDQPSPEDMETGTDEYEKYFMYLDALRESGVTNMYGAGAYLEDEFSLDEREARKILTKWMQTFSARHPREEHPSPGDREITENPTTTTANIATMPMPMRKRRRLPKRRKKNGRRARVAKGFQ